MVVAAVAAGEEAADEAVVEASIAEAALLTAEEAAAAAADHRPEVVSGVTRHSVVMTAYSSEARFMDWSTGSFNWFGKWD